MNWISVNEKLPETGEQVLCTKVWPGKKVRHQWVGFYTIGKDIEVSSDDTFDIDIEDDKDTGTAYLKAGWYEEEETPHSEYDYTYLHRDPTHWMPLPEPPKQ